MAFTDSGNAESLKGAVHGSLGTFAALCLVYNAAAWWNRRERHLAVNAVIYGLAVGFEAYQVTHHLQRRES